MRGSSKRALFRRIIRYYGYLHLICPLVSKDERKGLYASYKK